MRFPISIRGTNPHPHGGQLAHDRRPQSIIPTRYDYTRSVCAYFILLPDV